MIPFEVDPAMWLFPVVAAIIFFGLGVLAYLVDHKLNAGVIICAVATILVCLLCGSMIITGTAHTEKITICNHILTDGQMTVSDTNKHIYEVRGIENKLKITDGKTIAAYIEDLYGQSSVIYKIDDPITCINATCGGTG
jgi:hypothetical protein